METKISPQGAYGIVERKDIDQINTHTCMYMHTCVLTNGESGREKRHTVLYEKLAGGAAWCGVKLGLPGRKSLSSGGTNSPKRDKV